MSVPGYMFGSGPGLCGVVGLDAQLLADFHAGDEDADLGAVGGEERGKWLGVCGPGENFHHVVGVEVRSQLGGHAIGPCGPFGRVHVVDGRGVGGDGLVRGDEAEGRGQDEPCVGVGFGVLSGAAEPGRGEEVLGRGCGAALGAGGGDEADAGHYPALRSSRARDLSRRLTSSRWRAMKSASRGMASQRAMTFSGVPVMKPVVSPQVLQAMMPPGVPSGRESCLSRTVCFPQMRQALASGSCCWVVEFTGFPLGYGGLWISGDVAEYYYVYEDEIKPYRHFF